MTLIPAVPGWPPLVVASRGDKGEHPERLQALLELGADVNVCDYKGKTALHRAATAGFLASMEVLAGYTKRKHRGGGQEG